MGLAFWTADRDPMVLAATARATASDDPEALDLFSLPISAVILRDGATEHVLLADGPRRMRMTLRGDSIASGPVRLIYDRYGDFSPLRWKILLLNRLYALWRLHRFPCPLFPLDPVVARRVRALQAYDAHKDGAGQGEIIVAVLGPKMADEKSFDSSRKQVKRMLELAKRRIEIGRQLFLTD